MNDETLGELLERHAEFAKKAAHYVEERDWENALYYLDEQRWIITFIERDSRRGDGLPLTRRQAE